MADRDIKQQLKIDVVPKVSGAGIDGIAKQISSALGKELKTAISDALKEGFKEARATAQKTDKGARGEAAAIRTAQGYRSAGGYAQGLDQARAATEGKNAPQLLLQKIGAADDVRARKAQDRSEKAAERQQIKVAEVIGKGLRSMGQQAEREEKDGMKFAKQFQNVFRGIGKEDERDAKQQQRDETRRIKDEAIAARAGREVGGDEGGGKKGMGRRTIKSILSGIRSGNPMNAIENIGLDVAEGGSISSAISGGVIGVAGALLSKSVMRGVNNYGPAISFLKALGPAVNTSPGEQGRAGQFRESLSDQLMRDAQRTGMAPQEALQVYGTVAARAGGYGGGRMQQLQREAVEARVGYQVNEGVFSDLEFNQRAGGASGAFGATSAARRAVQLGFEGDREMNEFLGGVAGNESQARGRGTFANRSSIFGMVGGAAPIVGQQFAAQGALGVSGTGQAIAQGGVGRAPGGAFAGLMFLSAMSGVPMKDMTNAKQREIRLDIERNGLPADALQRIARQGASYARHSPLAVQQEAAQENLNLFGVPSGVETTNALLAGRPSPELQKLIRAPGQPTGINERLGAVVDPRVGRDAAIQAGDLSRGLEAAEMVQKFKLLNQELDELTNTVPLATSALKTLGVTGEGLKHY